MSAEDGSSLTSTFAIIISIVGLAIALTSLIIRWKKSKMEKLSHESQFIGNLHDRLAKLERKVPSSLQSHSDCVDYSIEYLNILSELCFFDKKKYLSEDIIEFFKNYLKTSLSLYDWLIERKILDEDKLEEHYVEIIKTCEKHEISIRKTLNSVFYKYS